MNTQMVLPGLTNLLIVLTLSLSLTACGMLELGIERTPNPVTPTTGTTPVSTSLPAGFTFAMSIQPVAGHPPGARLSRVLHGQEGVRLGKWSPDGAHLLLYAPAGPPEGDRAPSAEPLVVDVTSGAAWRTGDSVPAPYENRFAWLLDGSALFIAGGELWRAQASGQNRRSLTQAMADNLIALALSPDGSVVLAQGERSYWLIPTAGSIPRAVTGIPGGKGSAAWSPDESQVALWHENGTLYLINSESAAAHPLAKIPAVGPQPTPIFWMENDQLFFPTPIYPYNYPVLVEVANGAVRDLVSALNLPATGHTQYYCSPSPSGKHMAVTVAYLDEFIRINYLWNVATDELTPVASPVSFLGTWSPAGEQMWVQLGEEEENVLAVLDVRNGELRRIAAPAWPLSWAADGTRLAFRSSDGQVGVVPTDGRSQATVLVPSLGDDPVLEWAPAGRRLAIAVRPRSDSFYEDLYVIDLEPAETSASIGPGGELALLIGGPPVSLVNLSGGPPRKVGAENMSTECWLYFQWSPDGRQIVYCADADLWLLDVESGESQSLTTGDRWNLMPAWSPDGDWIAFTSRPLLPEESKTDWMQGERGGALAVIGSNGNDFRILDDDGIVKTPPSWSPTGRRLAYAADGELRLYDLGTHRRTVLSLPDFGLTNVAYLGGPAWSPDGRLIAVYFSRSAELAEWDALANGSAPDVDQGVAVLDLEARTARVLFEWQSPFVGTIPVLRWQPGGVLLLIEVPAAPRVPQQAGLWLADPATGQITAMPVASYDADWSPDGRWIVALDLDDRERLVLMDSEQPGTGTTLSRWPYSLDGLAWRPVAGH